VLFGEGAEQRELLQRRAAVGPKLGERLLPSQRPQDLEGSLLRLPRGVAQDEVGVRRRAEEIDLCAQLGRRGGVLGNVTDPQVDGCPEATR
jgi:hypothetical protein